MLTLGITRIARHHILNNPKNPTKKKPVRAFLYKSRNAFRHSSYSSWASAKALEAADNSSGVTGNPNVGYSDPFSVNLIPMESIAHISGVKVRNCCMIGESSPTYETVAAIYVLPVFEVLGVVAPMDLIWINCISDLFKLNEV